jgi:hypothetical protein
MTDYSHLSISEKVGNGVRILNQSGPAEWWDAIDLGKLDISSFDVCVLGQLYGNFAAGCMRIFGSFDDAATDKAARCGFNFPLTDPVALTNEWKRVIRTVRADAEWLSVTPPTLDDVPEFEPEDLEMPRLELTLDDVKLLMKRMKQIHNPDHSLLSTEIEIQGVRVVLK